MRPTVSTSLLLTLLSAIIVCTVWASDVPQELQPPDGQVLLTHLKGKGDQIYVCRNSKWQLKAPKAELYSKDGALAGTHFTGPTWQANDGSRVVGKVVKTSPSPEASAIPWLLLSAQSHGGTGILANVESIQRLETKGGVAPTTNCGAADENKEQSVPYEASYNFYVSRPSPSAH